MLWIVWNGKYFAYKVCVLIMYTEMNCAIYALTKCLVTVCAKAFIKTLTAVVCIHSSVSVKVFILSSYRMAQWNYRTKNIKNVNNSFQFSSRYKILKLIF